MYLKILRDVLPVLVIVAMPVEAIVTVQLAYVVALESVSKTLEDVLDEVPKYPFVVVMNW